MSAEDTHAVITDLDTAFGLAHTSDGEEIHRGEGREVSILAAREEITITHARYSGGQNVAGPHIHQRHTDAFYVLEGELTFRVGCEPETIAVPSGGFVAVPPGVAHSFGNAARRPARWLTIHAADGGFGAFMRGIRDGVEIEWDIAAVPTDGGLPARTAIVSPGVEREPLELEDRLGSIRGALPDLCVVEWHLREPHSGLSFSLRGCPANSLFLIEGELETTFGGMRETAGAGTLISVSGGMRHRHHCRGRARVLSFHTPGSASPTATEAPASYRFGTD